jgi:hypothetical protein
MSRNTPPVYGLSGQLRENFLIRRSLGNDEEMPFDQIIFEVPYAFVIN